ncbi:cytochrome c oxidase subunit III family protein [Sphingomonas sp. S17]|jgi:cytochrome o ubiquinol oxidase subunit 3|uniref:Cytochrome bo(3) ubiquinol oxidase subunit 3 n=2 Tax=Sphingomonas paucimobilis TaxID=13689 RepID=A0A411LIU4_SPHPI|nr:MULTISPECIES: cytochrome o ubiquinol oxidase subunit III [Sphingomonas]EGI54614.1 cytochrome c oxidase subunit III family protein [Sphingomonas sp. S17]MBQ1478876.1 cytochrome o ubiquinol oxidase subunit III [Sphingomonas sp.]MCM3678368.1 cytochrome o ubiquinol oxidase subunit III [Sphingomonas paucimobilis]MDG5969396.1 cytochrome o ubiquinol oxidase subunit III [Sphingomonas paucimobilis]NNG57026.1 cytochrome o ubiquinol oxidase subunit III [Sphingomonas paucimobilis]
MSQTAKAHDPNKLGRATEPNPDGPAPKRIIVSYGFWIFLLSDFILFSCFFAAYAVLHDATAGGPSGKDLFELPLVETETALLLLSSFACGLAGIATLARNMRWFQIAMAVTALLGAGFLALEAHEFLHLIGEGNGPGRSAFLSAFFALVGCHGFHVTLGLLWLTTMMAQTWAKGFREDILRRILCFSLFWHALDIIWVALFTMVYLMGVRG